MTTNTAYRQYGIRSGINRRTGYKQSSQLRASRGPLYFRRILSPVKVESTQSSESSSTGKNSLEKTPEGFGHARVTEPDQFGSPTFVGKPSEDPAKWCVRFDRFVCCHGWTRKQVLQVFPLSLRGDEVDWCGNQSEDAKGNFNALQESPMWRSQMTRSPELI